MTDVPMLSEPFLKSVERGPCYNTCSSMFPPRGPYQAIRFKQLPLGVSSVSIWCC